MTSARSPRYSVGDKINPELTVLGIVDDTGRDPVYIVWHHRAWCPMACKVFGTVEKARLEAMVLGALAHPNIVRLLGVGKPAHVLMEFLEGPTLRQFMRSRPGCRLRVSDALRVAIYLGAALTHLHERGFLHLDIKPSNVIVARGRPVLFDFGIARPQGDRPDRHIHGTDPYMAPEQCRGDLVTPATDIFGLGVTLYEMLTGHLPFADGTRRNPFPQTVAAPVPLRQRRRELPSALDRLVLRCLAQEPAARPAVSELLPSLHSFIHSGPQMWPSGFRPELKRSGDWRRPAHGAQSAQLL